LYLIDKKLPSCYNKNTLRNTGKIGTGILAMFLEGQVHEEENTNRENMDASVDRRIGRQYGIAGLCRRSGLLGKPDNTGSKNDARNTK
jgi:hypothetical protein